MDSNACFSSRICDAIRLKGFRKLFAVGVRQVYIVEFAYDIPAVYGKSTELRMSFPNSVIRKGNACTCLHKPGEEAEVTDTGDTSEIAERMVLLCEHLLQNRARSGIRLPTDQVLTPQFFQPYCSPCKGVVSAA